MIVKPYSSREVAEKIGVSLDCFYKNRETYRVLDGMPAPISRSGKMAWERSGFDAWLTRHHPARPTARPANDAAPVPMPGDNVAEWNGFLHLHYGA